MATTHSGDPDIVTPRVANNHSDVEHPKDRMHGFAYQSEDRGHMRARETDRTERHRRTRGVLTAIAAHMRAGETPAQRPAASQRQSVALRTPPLLFLHFAARIRRKQARRHTHTTLQSRTHSQSPPHPLISNEQTSGPRSGGSQLRQCSWTCARASILGPPTSANSPSAPIRSLDGSTGRCPSTWS